MNMNHNSHKNYTIYCIYDKSDIVYVGSAYDMVSRQKAHNRELRTRYNIWCNMSSNYVADDIYGYLFLKGISEVMLFPIATGYNDISIIGLGKFEWRRFIEEERYIKEFISKGHPLKNINYPTYYDESFIQRSMLNNNLRIRNPNICSSSVC